MNSVPTKIETVRDAARYLADVVRMPEIAAALDQIRQAMRNEPHRSGDAIRAEFKGRGFTATDVKRFERMIRFGQSCHHQMRQVVRP